MQEKIEEIRKQAEERIKEIRNSQELQELKVKVLGKKSELSNLLKGLGSLSPEERPKMGALVNEARKAIVEDLDKEILFKVYNPELSDTSVYTLNIPKPEKYFYSNHLLHKISTKAW